ncbi:MAG: cupin domain-containing protein [Bacteroidales bacterium]|nr:cupin domain-containing protein [Bacteroidales bacterium]
MKVWKPTHEEIKNAESWGTWGKEPSEFPWYYEEQETCLILEGKASAWDKHGNKITFEAGDMVQFEQGLECTWKISETIRKRFLFGDYQVL